MHPVSFQIHTDKKSRLLYDLFDYFINSCDVVSVSCVGVRVSLMFHFMFVHYTFSSVWVAEWPPFEK